MTRQEIPTEKVTALSDKIYDLIEKSFADPKNFSIDEVVIALTALKLNEGVLTDFIKAQGFDLQIFAAVDGGDCPVHGKNCPSQGAKH